jgi:diketogulonate reductase-like aldo/keto reductase
MEFKQLINSADIPVLGLGTLRMGGTIIADRRNDRENVLAIETALKLGMTHIDTAEGYGNGHTEELVGLAIQGFRREDLFITTKVRPQHLRYSHVILAARRSLERLGTSYVDLYLVHAPNPYIPIKETMKAMDYLVESNLARFIGVSNFSVEQLNEAQRFAKNRIVANQIEYNLLIRNKGQLTVNMESEIIPYCRENGIMIIAYRPLAKGVLAKPGIKILDDIAKKYDKTPAQVAINWLISKMRMVTITKTSKIEHIRENLGATGWNLSKEDISTLDNGFPSKK